MTSDSVSVSVLGSDAAIAVLRYQWVVGRSNAQPVTDAMTLAYVRTGDPPSRRDRGAA